MNLPKVPPVWTQHAACQSLQQVQASLCAVSCTCICWLLPVTSCKAAPSCPSWPSLLSQGDCFAPACRPKSKLRAKAMAIKMVAQLWADRQAEDYADPEANKGKSVSITVKM